MSAIHDPTICRLGEGPLWHPGRAQLFWFDILSNRLLTAGKAWHFEEHVSAAGWIDDETLLVASETALLRLDLATGTHERLCALEADTPSTRSNDGRADPWGGFWIGTMGKRAEPGGGAIYRYFRGEMRRLHAPLTIPNAICFPPGGEYAVFTDTPGQIVYRQPLAAKDGWPAGEPEAWLDLRADALRPDGAVIDADGRLWSAQWGAGRVACYGPDTAHVTAIAFPAAQTSCPAFGGPDLATLFCTSATDGLSATDLAAAPQSGMTFRAAAPARGQREHRVVL